MTSLKFFKPTLATALAIVFAWLLSVRPAQAGYIVTLRQVGPDVVATGSGAIDLTGLTFYTPGASGGVISPAADVIVTGPTPFGLTAPCDLYQGTFNGPLGFGDGDTALANSGTGDLVGILRSIRLQGSRVLTVPRGYVSGTALSDSAIYSDASLATLGVTPGTYVWKWGTGANQNFTLQTKTPVPASTAIWYLNNNAFVAGTYAPRLPVGWKDGL